MKFEYFAFKLKFLSLLIFLPVTIPTQGQNDNLLKINSLSGSGNININILIDKQTEYIKNSYLKKVETPKEIINGKEYISYYIRSTSKPLLFPRKRRSASLVTTSRKYTNLTLQYDTFLDEVIYTDTSRTFNYTFPQIALNKNIVDGFTLYFEDDSMHLKYLRLPQCSEVNLKEGFYETAYQGKSKYYIRHISTFYVRDGLNEYKYSPENYISTGGVFYKVTGRGSLLELFGEKSGEIKKFLHLSRIRIRQADKNQYISIMKYYDSLSKAQ